MATETSAGMPTSHRNPHIKGAKVKIALNAKGEPRKRLPKRPIEQLDGDTLQKQSTIYLRERNKSMRLKRQREEINLAVARDQLISKELAVQQLSYLMIVMRQKILSIPQKFGNHFGARNDLETRGCVRYLVEQCHEVLIELAKLPDCVEPNWLERLEEED